MRSTFGRLGKTDLLISPIGFGAAPFAGLYGDIPQEQADKAVQKAIDLGINFFDVAPLYSSKDKKSEEILGEALSKIPREKFVIETKCGRYGSNSSLDCVEFDFSAQSVKKSVQTSLKRLKVEYLDIIIVHDVEFAENLDQIINETVPALRELQKQGKVRYVGISGYPLDVLMYIARRVPLDVVLTYCHYNLQNTLLNKYIDEFNQLGCGVINASPLALGLLTPKEPASWHPIFTTGVQGFDNAINSLNQLCESKGTNLAELAMKWAVHSPLAGNELIATTLVGCCKEKEVEDACNSLEGNIDQELVKQVQEIMKPYHNITWKSGVQHLEI